MLLAEDTVHRTCTVCGTQFLQQTSLGIKVQWNGEVKGFEITNRYIKIYNQKHSPNTLQGNWNTSWWQAEVIGEGAVQFGTRNTILQQHDLHKSQASLHSIYCSLDNPVYEHMSHGSNKHQLPRWTVKDIVLNQPYPGLRSKDINPFIRIQTGSIPYRRTFVLSLDWT